MSPIDWILFAASLLGFSGIGIYYACKGNKQDSVDSVLLADRKLPILPTAFSLVASFMSAVSLLGYPAEIYQFGTMFCWYGVTELIVFPVAAYLFVPVFFPLKLTSVYEYLELRFDRNVRLVSSIVFCTQMTLYLAVVLYAPALALSSVCGLAPTVAILITGFVGTLYTAIGGVKAVVWTSVVQMALIFAGLLAVVVSGSVSLGGMGKVWSVARDHWRIEFDDTRVDPRVRHSVWSLVIGGSFTILTLYTANQLTVQRFVAMPKLRNAQIAMVCNIPINWCLLTLYTLCGLILFAKYHACDPKKLHLIDRADQLLPYYVMNQFGNLKGLPGLFISAVYSAGLSTLSSGLNSMSAVVLQDFVSPLHLRFKGYAMSEALSTRITKWSAVLLGILSMANALLFNYIQSSTVLQISLSIFGMAGGPLLGTFILGIFVPFSNSKGALLGLLISLAICSWIGIGAILTGIPPIPRPTSILGCSAAHMNTTDMNSSGLLSTDSPASFNELIRHNNSASDIRAADFDDVPSVSNIYSPISGGLYNISYQYYSVIGVLAVLIFGMVFSLIFRTVDGGNIKPVNANLLSPYVRSSSSYQQNDLLHLSSKDNRENDNLVLESAIMNESSIIDPRLSVEETGDPLKL